MRRLLPLMLLALAAAVSPAAAQQNGAFSPSSPFNQNSPFNTGVSTAPAISSATVVSTGTVVSSTAPATAVSTAPAQGGALSSPTFYLIGGPPKPRPVSKSTSTVGQIFAEPFNPSGAVLTPTAYRAWGKPGLGPSVDVNAMYFIGRLYGQNTFPWSTSKTDYLDQLGVWFLSIDGKYVVQHETKWVPQTAAGLEGTYVFRDAAGPQPAAPNVNTSISPGPGTAALASAYIVFSKKIWGQYWSAGYEGGSEGSRVGYLSEYLTPISLEDSGYPGRTEEPSSVYFVNGQFFPNTQYAIKAEYMVFSGGILHPYLINLHIGALLHLNFDISYLGYDGGYDVLGTFGFRYSMYPHPGFGQ